MATRKTNTTFHSEGREIIANIIEKCDEEKAQMQFLLPLSKATKRAAMYAGVSCSAIKKIRQENKHIRVTVVSFPLAFPPKFCTLSSPLPCVPLNNQ
jgi:hypothetical protein